MDVRVGSMLPPTFPPIYFTCFFTTSDQPFSTLVLVNPIMTAPSFTSPSLISSPRLPNQSVPSYIPTHCSSMTCYPPTPRTETVASDPAHRSPTQITARLDRLIATIRSDYHTSAIGKPSDDVAAQRSDVLLVAHGHILRAFAMRWIGKELTEGVSLLLEGMFSSFSFWV